VTPNKLVNIVEDEFPDTERTIFNIIKEEESVQVSYQNELVTEPMSTSKKKKKVFFPSKEVSEAEEETKPPEVFSSVTVSNKSPNLSKLGSQEISRKGSNRNLNLMNSKLA